MTDAARPWTPADEQTLREHWGLVADATLARRLGRTVGAIRLRAARRHLRRTDNFHTATAAAALLGVEPHAVRRWIDQDLLHARRAPFKVGHRGRPWLIRDMDLVAFVRAHPELLDLRRLPPSPLRTLLARLVPPDHVAAMPRPWTAAEDRYLLNNRRTQTHAQIARHLNRTPESIHARLVWLRAEHPEWLLPYAPNWRARRRNGTDTAPRLWTADEDAYLRTHWGRERAPDEPGRGPRITSAEIAAALGRTRYGVEARASRLGLDHGSWTNAERWTADEDAYLRMHWQPDTARGVSWARAEAIAAALSRTVAACRRRATQLGVRGPLALDEVAA